MRGATAVVVMLACGCAAAPAPPPATASTASAPDAPARIETVNAWLEIASDPGANTAQPSQLTLTLEGRGGFHVNLEYPLRVELQGSGAAEFHRVTLGPGDAAELTEARARFSAPVRWHATGRQWLGARVQFAVCSEDACIPQEHALAIELQVQ